MADWYVDTSASVAGDGTAPGTATIAGGVGAANSFIDVMKNIYTYITTMTAGDTIYVRTHDGTNNCTQPITADTTVVVPTDKTTPTTIIFDNGTKWANAGVFRLDAGASYGLKLSFKDYVNVYADGDNRRFEYYSSYTGTQNLTALTFYDAVYDGMHINAPNYRGALLGNLANSTLLNPKVTTGYISSNNYIFYTGNLTCIPIANLEIEFTLPTSAHWSIFKGSPGGIIEVVGGKLIGYARSDVYTHILDASYNYSVKYNLIDFDTGLISTLINTRTWNGESNTIAGTKVSMLGYRKPFDFIEESSARVEYAQDDNYPYLNATLPNSTNEPWSYKVSPMLTQKGFLPYSLPPIVKIFNQPAAIKTLTLEFLMSTAFTGLTKEDLHATFVYRDATTGDIKTISTLEVGTALVESPSASWSNTTYGSKSYNKYKIEVTTPTAIQQGSKITARVVSAIPEAAADDFWFMDPDVTIS